VSPVAGTEPAQRKGHRPPPPEDSQPLRPAGHVPEAGARSQAGGGSGFVTVNDRLFAPLQGLNPNNILMGGYGWLSYTDGGATLHPGLDLNSGSSCNDDEGALVVAPLAGVVRHTLYAASGEGNHVWIEIDDPCSPGPTWVHFDHLLRVDVREEQRLAPGEGVGLCGRSGGWDCAHLHLEACKGAPSNGPWQWPYGWSRAQVEAEYWNPHFWWDVATTLVLAEGNQPIPPEAVMAMSDWELTNYVLAQLYEWAGQPFNPEGGLTKTWVAAMRAGHYPGRPRTGERHYGDHNAGVWGEFDYGVLIWKNDGTMSWTG
jgi:hypothetical protein